MIHRQQNRLYIWAAIVLIISLVLGAQATLPNLTGLESSMVLSIFLAALFCEYVDSSLGMGYGTTLTPLLLLAEFEPLQIVPCVLLSELITGTFAGLMHHHDGNIDLLRNRQTRKTILLLSILSTIGTVIAVTLAIQVSKFWLTAFIAAIILSMGVIILITIRQRMQYRRSHIVALGTVAAFNKGLSGGGYGPLVTAGQIVSGVPAKNAVAITSLAEAFTCLVGLITYLLIQREIDWTLAIPLTLGAVLSVPIATLTVQQLPDTVLQYGIGTITTLLGVLIFAKLLL